jgi:hypothetical protein
MGKDLGSGALLFGEMSSLGSASGLIELSKQIHLRV